MSRSAAYFDVDGTLVGTNLVHPTILHMVNQETMLASAARVRRASRAAPAPPLRFARYGSTTPDIASKMSSSLGSVEPLGRAFRLAIRPDIASISSCSSFSLSLWAP